MKSILSFLLFFLLNISDVFSQTTPPGIPYQAIARNANGTPYVNANLTVRFSLHEQTATGTVSYSESKSLQTNDLGLFSTTFGSGTPITGTFAGINWSQTTKFLQVEINLGSAWVDMGTQQLMSVPYAMYAGSTLNNTSPSNPPLLYFFASINLTNSTVSIPSNETWKLVSINRSPQLGPITVNIPFFEPYFDKCIYAFTSSQRYNLLNINSLQYAVGYPYTYPNSGTTYQIFKDCGGAVCNNCPSFQTISFTPDYSILSSINLPLWINSGSTIEVADGVILTIEKFKN